MRTRVHEKNKTPVTSKKGTGKKTLRGEKKALAILLRAGGWRAQRGGSPASTSKKHNQKKTQKEKKENIV